MPIPEHLLRGRRRVLRVLPESMLHIPALKPCNGRDGGPPSTAGSSLAAEFAGSPVRLSIGWPRCFPPDRREYPALRAMKGEESSRPRQPRGRGRRLSRGSPSRLELDPESPCDDSVAPSSAAFRHKSALHHHDVRQQRVCREVSLGRACYCTF